MLVWDSQAPLHDWLCKEVMQGSRTKQILTKMIRTMFFFKYTITKCTNTKVDFLMVIFNMLTSNVPSLKNLC